MMRAGMVALAVVAGAAAAQDVDAWNAARAGYFSDLCMETAPSFAGLGQAAGAERFQAGPGSLFRDEVNVSLQSAGDTCTCYMTMGAPDLNSLVTTVFQTLLTDFPDAWAPSSRTGTINDTTFVRDGVPVRLLLEPARIDGANWLAARVVAPGACRR